MRRLNFIMVVCLVSGCSLESPLDYGDTCAPNPDSQAFVRIGSLECYKDHMAGECVDKQGGCLQESSCLTACSVCANFQADFDRLSGLASPVSFVGSQSNNIILEFAHLFSQTSGQLLRCPGEYPFCVWTASEKNPKNLEFGCISCLDSVCGTSCVNLDKNTSHCGTCFNACGGGAECDNGACRCGDGDILCDTRCVNPLNNPDYCGAKDDCLGKNRGMRCAQIEACIDGVCQVQCGENQHAYEGICEDDSIAQCGGHDKDCAKMIENWQDGRCENGQCVVLSCQTGYGVKDGRCVVETSNCCGADCLQCKSAAVCDAGQCVGLCTEQRSQCIREDGVSYCVNLKTASSDCGACGNSCSPELFDHASDVRCHDGSCKIESCLASFHLYENQCEADDLEHCGAHGNSCRIENFENSGAIACVNKECRATLCLEGFVLDEFGNCIPESSYIECEQTQHVYQGACEMNDNANCGKHGNICSTDVVAGSADVMCTYGVCRAERCVQGYHLNGGHCEQDSALHCGSHDHICDIADFPNSGAVKCQDGACVIANCQSGYTLENGECRKNILKCNANQYEYQGECILSDANHCGGNDVVCKVADVENSTDVFCSYGNHCSARACRSGYHVYAYKIDEDNDIAVCEADSKEHCGGHDTLCSIDLIENSTSVECVSSTCRAATCKARYYEEGGACVKETSCPNPTYYPYHGTCYTHDKDNCGGRGKKCTTDTVAHSTKVECVSIGVCMASACEEGYFLNDSNAPNNTCDPYDDLNCGCRGCDCNVMIPYASEGKCVNKSCVPTQCKNGFVLSGSSCTCPSGTHYYNNTCEANSNENCGAHGKACVTAAIANSASASCSSSGSCNLTCQSGYHVYNGQCEANSISNCGGHGTACTLASVPNSTTVNCSQTKGICIAVGCQSGYKLFQPATDIWVCVKDS